MTLPCVNVIKPYISAKDFRFHVSGDSLSKNKIPTLSVASPETTSLTVSRAAKLVHPVTHSRRRSGSGQDLVGEIGNSGLAFHVAFETIISTKTLSICFVSQWHLFF